MAPERFYLTTPIYYVNDRPHVGHAYTSVVCDVLTRCHRLLGIDTWFLTGTDEHGQKVQDAAEARGVPPQQHVDEMVVHFRGLLDLLGTAHDVFNRTTDAAHTSVVTKVLQLLHDEGHVYLDTYDGWYCTRCERYFTDRDVEETGGELCPEFPERHEVARVSEENYFFRMSAFSERLVAAIGDGSFEIVPTKRRNEVLGFLRQGLGDLCISRSRERLSWGVPLPFDERFVCYVWVDALFNYATAVGLLSDDERFARWWPADVHVIGKDILTTHCVYWPTFLMAAGLPLPRRVLAHGWLLDPKGGKLSKTKRLDDDGAEAALPTIESLLDVCGRDAVRWFLATAGKPGDDMPFSWEIVIERLNADLANGIGNTANRLLKLAAGPACGGVFPELPDGVPADVRDCATSTIAALRAVPDTHDVLRVVAAVRATIDAISLHLNDEKPWKLVKDEATVPRAGEVIAVCLEALRLVGVAITPFVPDSAARLRAALGWTAPLDLERESQWGEGPVGAALGEPPNLFPRLSTKNVPAA